MDWTMRYTARSGCHVMMGCSMATITSCSPDGQSTEVSLSGYSIHNPFAPASVLYAMKDNKPFILMNMAPDLDGLKLMDASAQEEYLLKRTLVNLIDFGSGRKEYKDYDHFVIKIVLMNQVDEYGRDKWGSALDLAAVEVDRLAIRALRSGDLDALTLEDTRGLFASRRLFLVNIAKANKK